MIRKFQSTLGTGMGHQADSHSSPEALILGMLTDDESMFVHLILGKKIYSTGCVRGTGGSPLLSAKLGLNLWRNQIKNFISLSNAWR